MAQTTIQGSFLGDGTVTGVKIGADFISAQTALASGLATTDEIIVSDAGVIKRMDISVLEIAATQITASGTLPALNGSALTALSAANITASGTLPALNGAALTALNGTQVTSGTLPAARIAADSIVEGKLNVSNAPTNGQVLTARDGVAGGFTWEAAASGTTINTNADNRVITGSASAGTLNGEANLTFDGTSLGIGASTSPSNVLHLFKADGSDVGITFSSIGVMTFALGIDDTDNVFKINGSSLADQSAFGIDQHKTVGINMLTGTASWGIGGEGGYPLIIKGRNDNNLVLLADSADTDAGTKIASFERGSGGSSGAHSYVSQSAVSIMKAGGAGGRGALLLVHGEQDGDTNTFLDMVTCPVTGGFSNNGYSSPSNTDNGTGNVIFRMNMRGSPSARTYSLGATNTIYLAMASGNWNIVTTLLGLSGIAT